MNRKKLPTIPILAPLGVGLGMLIVDIVMGLNVAAAIFVLSWVVLLGVYNLTAASVNRLEEPEPLKAIEASKKLEKLVELNEAWDLVIQEDTIEAYERYASMVDEYTAWVAGKKPTIPFVPVPTGTMRGSLVTTISKPRLPETFSEYAQKTIVKVPRIPTYEDVYQFTDAALQEARAYLMNQEPKTNFVWATIRIIDEEVKLRISVSNPKVSSILDDINAQWHAMREELNEHGKANMSIAASMLELDRQITAMEYRQRNNMKPINPRDPNWNIVVRQLDTGILSPLEEVERYEPENIENKPLMLLPPGAKYEEVDGVPGIIVGMTAEGEEIWAPLSAFKQMGNFHRPEE